MPRPIFAIAAFAFAAAACPASLAITEQPMQAGFQDQRLALSAAARAGEGWGDRANAGASTPSAAFTGARTNDYKRKAFPPGFGRSGYEFEDEVIARQPAPKPEAPAK
jgi:hypothetical protein